MSLTIVGERIALDLEPLLLRREAAEIGRVSLAAHLARAEALSAFLAEQARLKGIAARRP
ncbi:hypothetical protein MZO42_13315 [Sphingomonas psychrotolerans]|uniref:Uncharacterized protein n=1 Tax=Sphingomonas psychrotolerans TaxID=1327635 RepID=A0ABU3N584_9SPHN|nr:hypothetical protein [Sphingomonas psychrotolerans]MDT8759679.1 hypothetical protein [Sphingomonas psychrotolerans]